MRPPIAIAVASIGCATSACFSDAVIWAVPAPAGTTDPEIRRISGDGTVAVGLTHLDGIRPLFWSRETGSVDLAGAASGRIDASGCSGAGNVVTAFGSFFGGTAGYVRRLNSGWEMMPIPNGYWLSAPVDVSIDGLAIAGFLIGSDGYPRLFRWTDSLGYEILSNDPSRNAVASAMSADGSTIAGYQRGTSLQDAFVWHQSTGIVGIPLTWIDHSMAVSAQGDFVVASKGSGTTAGIWLYDRRQQSLERINWYHGGSVSGTVGGISQDGSIIVGRNDSFMGRAFLWTRQSGARELAAILTSQYGLDLTGWDLRAATAISNDGQVMAGDGVLNGVPTSWVVMLSEPHPYRGRESCQGDVDGNGTVDVSDIMAVMSEFNSWDGALVGDCSGDAVVDALDLNIVLLDMGQRCPRRIRALGPAAP